MNTSKALANTSRHQVLHVLTSLDFGGVEKRMEILAQVNLDGTMRHSFVAINGGGAAAVALAGLGVQAYCLHKCASIPSMPALFALYRYFRKIRPTVVHTHGAEANFHGLLAARLAGVPVRIGEEIGIPQHSRKAKLIFTQVFRFAQRVVGISDAVTRWLVESGEVPATKAVRIYNPVRLTPDYTPRKKSSGMFRIGFVGRLEPIKNPLALVDACGLLVKNGISAELHIVGEGSQRGKIESRVSELKLADRVFLHGYQSDPISFMRACDIYVQPSISEGFGLALVEAMGCGLPVIATAVGGAPEFIRHGENGWLLDEATPVAVAGALQTAIACGEPNLLKIGTEARRSVLDRFLPGAYLIQLEHLYASHLPSAQNSSFG